MKRPTILICVVFLLTATFACDRGEVTPEIRPNDYVEDVRRLREFKSIKAGKSVRLKVFVGEDFSVVVKSPEAGINDLKTEVEDDALIISSRPGRKEYGNPIIVDVSLPELARLDLWGSSEATVTNVRSDELTLQCGGESKIFIDGSVKNVKMVSTGVGRIDAEKLTAINAEVKAAGASQVVLRVSDELQAEAHGASKILFVDEPKKLLQSVIGAGVVSKK